MLTNEPYCKVLPKYDNKNINDLMTLQFIMIHKKSLIFKIIIQDSYVSFLITCFD